MIISEVGDEPRLLVSSDGLHAPWVDGNYSFPGYSDTIPALYHDSDQHGNTYDAITRKQWFTPAGGYREIRGTAIMRGHLKAPTDKTAGKFEWHTSEV
jgi:hypothetical protein